MTPQTTDFELRAVELIQTATMVRRKHIKKAPHLLDELQVKCDGFTVEMFPYNARTKRFLNEMISIAWDKGYSYELFHIYAGNKMNIGIRFSPHVKTRVANPYPIYYHDLPQRRKPN